MMDTEAVPTPHDGNIDGMIGKQRQMTLAAYSTFRYVEEGCNHFHRSHCVDAPSITIRATHTI